MAELFGNARTRSLDQFADARERKRVGVIVDTELMRCGDAIASDMDILHASLAPQLGQEPLHAGIGVVQNVRQQDGKIETQLVRHALAPLWMCAFVARAAHGGSTSRVSAVAVSNPPITTVARGFCTSAPAPVAMAIGMKPTMATSAVVRTARRRLAAPAAAASIGKSPALRRSRIACISTKPLSVATPDTAIKPTAADTEKGIPRISKASAPPTKARGTQANTRPASLMLPRARNSSTPINAKTNGTTTISRCSARWRFSNWPPQSRYMPAGSAVSATDACACATNPPKSRPRTLACTTMRRLPFSRLIWLGPSLI